MTGTIGERIRQLRTGRLPKLTQRELAERAGVSVDLISKLEQGTKQSALLVTLHKLARALDVDITALVSHPARVDVAGDDQDAGFLAVRRAVIAVRNDGDPSTIEELQRSVSIAWGHYWSFRLDTLGAVLPDLIGSARATVRETESPAAFAALSDVYGVTASMLTHLGKVDLAYLTMERAIAAADRSDDELRRSALFGWMSWLLLHQTGSFGEAKYIAIREADNIEPRMKNARPQEISAWGSLLTSAAVAAARDENADEADDLINLAEVAATRLDGMGYPVRTDYETQFGLSRVIMQSVDIAVVTNRPARALKIAQKMPADTDWPLASRARHLADKAFALTALGKNREAEGTLLTIRRLAPQWMQYQAYPRVIISELWERERRGRSSALQELGEWLNVPLN